MYERVVLRSKSEDGPPFGAPWESNGLFSQDEVYTLRAALQDFLRAHGRQCTQAVSVHQPFLLDVLRALLQVMDDADAGLPDLLRDGVPTSVTSQVVPSGVFPQDERVAEDAHKDWHTDVRWCNANWATAADDSTSAMGLLMKDAEQGFAEVWGGSLEEAERPWPRAVALGT